MNPVLGGTEPELGVVDELQGCRRELRVEVIGPGIDNMCAWQCCDDRAQLRERLRAVTAQRERLDRCIVPLWRIRIQASLTAHAVRRPPWRSQASVAHTERRRAA